jgi:ADP-dependent NAD(P)H-hydrate dehydratase / NAD(P)H-hydrate epimerase
MEEQSNDVLASVDSLPHLLYRAEGVRQLDRIAIEGGIPGFTLMRRAGKHTLRVLMSSWPEVEKITVLCGAGNNGGDGFVLATAAHARGIEVEVIQLGDAKKIQGDALQARQQAVHDDIPITPFSTELSIASGVIVDAMLGTGLSGDVRAEYQQAIALINKSANPVIAVDIPSGLCSDSGRVLGSAVKAHHTVSFIGLKQGLLTGSGPDYTGTVHFNDLSVPEQIYDQVDSHAVRLDLSVLASKLAKRTKGAHKGHFGHVWIAGGDSGMAGAALMSSHAACRVGAGLISCATRPEHISAMVSRCPEVMVHGVISGQEVEPLLASATVIVVGPGLGMGPWGEQLLQKVMQLPVPLVVDADALNILSAGRVIKKPYRDNWILTPHPGEAARLLGCSTQDVQSDRFAAVDQLQKLYGGAVILKGAGTLVADLQYSTPGLCAYGNPGMATGGMGDILSGVLGALLAQGLDLGDAARLGVCLHARAGDLAARDGERGTLATDLIPHLRRLVNL